MSQKLIRGLLGFAVLGVWGILGYRYFSSSDPMEYDEVEAYDDFFFMVDQDSLANRSSGKLALNYKDPFLNRPYAGATQTAAVAGTGSTQIKQTQKTTTKVIPKTVNQNTVVHWPAIQYFGLVKSVNSNRAVGLLNIDGKELVINEKDSVNHVIIQALTLDSTVLVYKNEVKTYYK